jgi:cobalt-zinc-cadmium efflux system membrane fusion protein
MSGLPESPKAAATRDKTPIPAEILGFADQLAPRVEPEAPISEHPPRDPLAALVALTAGIARLPRPRAVMLGALGLLALVTIAYLRAGGVGAAAADAPATSTGASGDATLDLNEKQREAIAVGPVAERLFPQEKEAYGSIDYDEDRAVQVFTPYQGRIIEAMPQLGDEVTKGQVMFTIESTDLIQAESTLIAAAGVLDLTSRALRRARELYEKQALAQKDLEQAVSDQQTAEGALKAARDAVRIFGKTDDDMDRMIAQRRVDRNLIVPSPISGRITARNAQPGLFVQPGSPPAPYTVADLSTLWMIANVNELDSALFHVGQPVAVSVMAFPGRTFDGKISRIATAVDPNIHRLLVRSEIADLDHELRPGMFANFTIRTGDPIQAVAVPLDGVVREGDGTMTVWVTTDRRRFTQRTVTIGLQKDGYDQIVDGLKPGELIATKGAVFLSNMLYGGES